MRFSFRLLIFHAALTSAPFSLAAPELEGARAPAVGPCPTVDQAIAKMSVPEGYAVRCFASEPMVINPVAMTWDARGRLWVVELYEYPNGAGKPNAYSKTATDEEFRPIIPQEKDSPRDRVIILEDTDNDGVADKRTVFAEGLNLATAILCGHGGVFIGQAPNLFFFRDTNGDDKADEYKTVLTGFGLEDRHELLNSFTWGPDGWMYFTHGVFTHSKVRRPEQKPDEGITLNAGVFRVKLETVARPVPALSPEPRPAESKPSPNTTNNASGTNGLARAVGASPALPKAGTGLATGPVAADFEVYADGTSNPWGVDFDARGNAFVEACVIDHFFHMAPGGLYARQGGAPENPYAYELLPSIVGKDHPRHFRAAYAGIAIYQGGVYPADTHGHAFFGNIHDNAIHEEAMDPVGATFKARPIRDFLRANDGWFRPVSIQTGPDGFLWVMDWCDKYPCYQNALANPEGVDREKGRIWRVCYTGSPEGNEMAGKSRPEADLDLSKIASEKFLARISNSNSWIRRTAMVHASDLDLKEIIIEASQQITQVKKGAPTPVTPPAAYTLSAMVMEATEGAGIQLHSDDGPFQDAALRRPAILTWADYRKGEVPSEEEISLIARMAADKDPLTRTGVAVAVRKVSAGTLTGKQQPGRHQSLWPVLNQLIASGTLADKAEAFHIWMALEPHVANEPKQALMELARLSPTTKPLSRTLTNKSARRIIDTRSPANVDLLLTFLDQLKDHDDLIAAALEGILKASEAGPVKPDKTDPTPFFVRWSQSASPDVKNRAARLATLWGDPAAVAAVITEAANTATPLPRRIELLETLRKLRTPATKQAVLDLLTAGGPDNWLIPVLRAANEVGSGDEFSTPVLKLWPAASPALRTASAQFLTGRIEWQQRLLAAVEKPDATTGIQIPARELPATTRRFFGTNSDPEIHATAERVLGRWSDSNDQTKALIATKRKALTEGEPDMAMGKILFQALCATCHKFHGGGQEVGPELIGSGRSNLDAILANVIDPNQIIGNGYRNFLVTTKDGRTLAGRIVEDTPTQVTLLGIGGSREVVPAADIAKKEDTGLSLMPMGFGSLPDDQLRNLIWYILAPPEEGALTPEKKQELIQGAEAEKAPAPLKMKAKEYPRIDWESVSLWNPEWKVTAPEFEGTPRKLTDFEGRKNVLQLHPFPDKKSPSHLSRTFTVPATGQPALAFDVSAKSGHDWDLVIRVNGIEAQRQSIHAEGAAWKPQRLDLTPWLGQNVAIQLENHPTGWSWEFSYWSHLKFIP